MSGPKGYGYRVVSAAELERRAVAALQGRCTELASRCRAVTAQAARLGVAQTGERRAPRGSDLAAWQAYETELRTRLDEHRTTLLRAQHQACLAEISGGLAGNARPISLGLTSAATQAPKPPINRELERALGSAAAAIARVDDPAARESLTERARRIVAGDSAAAEGQFTVLRVAIQRELRDQLTRRRLKQRVDELDLQLAGLPGPEAAALRCGLPACTIAADLDRAEQQAQEISARVAAEQDRRFVVAQAAGALRRLGYEVGEDFAAAAEAGRAALVQPPEQPAHQLQIRFLPTGDRFLTQVVGLAPTVDAAADTAAELATCAHLDAAQRDLADVGVETVRFHQRPAGQVPVARATAAAAESGCASAAARQSAQAAVRRARARQTGREGQAG